MRAAARVGVRRQTSSVVTFSGASITQGAHAIGTGLSYGRVTRFTANATTTITNMAIARGPAVGSVSKFLLVLSADRATTLASTSSFTAEFSSGSGVLDTYRAFTSPLSIVSGVNYWVGWKLAFPTAGSWIDMAHCDPPSLKSGAQVTWSDDWVELGTASAAFATASISTQDGVQNIMGLT